MLYNDSKLNRVLLILSFFFRRAALVINTATTMICILDNSVDASPRPAAALVVGRILQQLPESTHRVVRCQQRLSLPAPRSKLN